MRRFLTFCPFDAALSLQTGPQQQMLETKVIVRATMTLLAGCCVSAAALAQATSPTGLPSLALSPQPQQSIWNGFFVGSEVFAISRKGAKGLIGGGVTAGYNTSLPNNFILGISTSAGYAPAFYAGSGVRGFDYAKANIKLGYDMGRLMPYVTTGVVLAKPNFGNGYLSATDSTNNLFNGSSNLRSAASVGAGFDYAITKNLTVGIGVSVGNSRAFGMP
jgi:opacity protein-like surface antigen